jgi:hypothetical protein
MEKGDRFVFYGKCGIVKGTVENIVEKSAIDVPHGLKVIRTYIVSESGEKFDTRDCLKLEKEMLPAFLRKIKNSFT